MKDHHVIVIGASAVVVVVAMLTGHDGQALAAFFALLAGLGLGRKQREAS